MSWGVALRNAVGLGLGGIPSLLNAPPYAKLAFNFLSGELDPRITFSRTSNATLIGSDGTLQYAPHNLLTYSEQFDNAAWGVASGTVTANAGVAPNGTTTADQISSTGAGVFRAGITVTQGVLHTASVYAKPISGSDLFVFGFDVNPINGRATFNLSTGAVSSLGANVVAASAEALPNGWYRCIVSAITTGSTCNLVYYNATSGSNWFVWGAQLNVGALQPYYSTTVKNLQGYSQEFDDAAWIKSNSTVTANVTAAPDGSLTADKLSEDTATIGHYLGPATTIVGVLGQVNTFSCYAKAAERTFLQLIFTGVAPGSGNYIAGFDLSTGVAGTPTAGVTSRIVDVGNGWFRCSMTATVQTAANIGRQIRISLNSSSTPSSYTGDGTSGIYVWGTQFSDSASLDPYVYNPAAAPSNTAYYGPRADYDPVTLAPKGWLIEEQRTNSIRNNTMQGAVAGTPGTLPTNWSTFTSLTGLTREVVGTGTETGINYIDIRLSGTPSAAGTYLLLDEANNGVAALTGQAWTHSLFVALAAGSTTGVSSITTVFEERTSANAFVAEQISTAYTITATALGGTRQSKTATTNGGATTAFLNAYFRLTLTGAAIDFTIRIGLPQLELGAFATSVIPTTTAAATRAADVASMTGANFSNWFNSAQGTMFVEAQQPVIFAASKTAASFTDGTNANRLTLYRQAGGFINAFSNPGGVALSSGLAATAGVTWKSALAYSSSPASFSANGVTPLSLFYTVNPNVFTELAIGNAFTGGNEYFNGYIRSFKYYQTRLSNNQLQSLTALPTPKLSHTLLQIGLTTQTSS